LYRGEVLGDHLDLCLFVNRSHDFFLRKTLSYKSGMGGKHKSLTESPPKGKCISANVTTANVDGPKILDGFVGELLGRDVNAFLFITQNLNP
jgi:hypothetical protein